MMLLKMHEVRKYRVKQAEGLNDSVFISVFAVIIFCIHRKNAANMLHIYRIPTQIWQNTCTIIKARQASPGHHHPIHCIESKYTNADIT